jgi:hypothetical protein
MRIFRSDGGLLDGAGSHAAMFFTVSMSPPGYPSAWIAVGMIIADHPRTDPYERNYRIRLLPWIRASKRTSG